LAIAADNRRLGHRLGRHARDGNARITSPRSTSRSRKGLSPRLASPRPRATLGRGPDRGEGKGSSSCVVPTRPPRLSEDGSADITTCGRLDLATLKRSPGPIFAGSPLAPPTGSSRWAAALRSRVGSKVQRRQGHKDRLRRIHPRRACASPATTWTTKGRDDDRRPLAAGSRRENG
jgi:hypothetical protein